MRCFEKNWDPVRTPLGDLQPQGFSLNRYPWLLGDEDSIYGNSPMQLVACLCFGSLSNCDFKGLSKVIVGVANTWTDHVTASVEIRNRYVDQPANESQLVLSKNIEAPVSFDMQKERVIGMWEIEVPIDDGLMWGLRATLTRLDVSQQWVKVSSFEIWRQLFKANA